MTEFSKLLPFVTVVRNIVISYNISSLIFNDIIYIYIYIYILCIISFYHYSNIDMLQIFAYLQFISW